MGTQEKLGVAIISIIAIILLKHADLLPLLTQAVQLLPFPETWVVDFLLGSSLRQKEALNPFPGETKIWFFFCKWEQGRRRISFESFFPPSTCPPAFPVSDHDLVSQKIILPHLLKCDTWYDL